MGEKSHSLLTNCQAAVHPPDPGIPGSFPHPRGPGLLTASSEVAQQHDLSPGFCEPSHMARNDGEKPRLVFLPRASEPYLRLGRDLRYSVGTPVAHPAHCPWPGSAPHLQAPCDHWERSLPAVPCPGSTPHLQARWDHWERSLLACRPMLQPRCTLMLSDVPSARLQCPPLPPEPDTSNRLRAAV